MQKLGSFLKRHWKWVLFCLFIPSLKGHSSLAIGFPFGVSIDGDSMPIHDPDTHEFLYSWGMVFWMLNICILFLSLPLIRNYIKNHRLQFKIFIGYLSYKALIVILGWSQIISFSGVLKNILWTLDDWSILILTLPIFNPLYPLDSSEIPLYVLMIVQSMLSFLFIFFISRIIEGIIVYFRSRKK